ncbi:MAG TPA: efflux transporter outer membrane subunit [Terriglobia bacterium]|nr:efflux transporter outer membrane subunit [Terriglobia bacterium]
MSRWRVIGFICAAAAGLSGCVVGPKYSRPSAQVPGSYKEQTAAPAASQNVSEKWWLAFNDPQLNALEDQVKVSNQNLKASEAAYRQARALVRIYRADLYPTGTFQPAASRYHSSDNKPPVSSFSGRTYNDYVLPGDVSYEVDAWGRVRHNVLYARESAQASAADLAALNLSLEAELATDYFELRSADAQERLLDSTVGAYEKTLQLTEDRHAGGLASDLDVQQADTQLEATRSQATDAGVARAQFEHAIAVLIGKPPSGLNLAFSPATEPPPVVPAGLPSEILQRRPDVAAAERRLAAANEQIGIAQAAYYPSISLTAAGGFESGALGTLLQGPALFYTLGAGAAETLFDVGRRRGGVEQAQAGYDQTVATYRQTILTAFQEVEDNLSALRILDQESKSEGLAVHAATRATELSLNQYKGGIASYLQVLTAQTTQLTDQRAAVDILRRRLDASVALIKALGGGWDVTTGIPQAEQMATGSTGSSR